MNSTPLDELADELGAITGRIERDQRLRLDAVIADLRRIDAERELRLVNLERQVADRLVAIKDGAPGRSLTVDDVAPVIAAEVARQVASLPPAEAGRSVTVDDVRPLLAEMIAALPPAEAGKSVTVEEVAPVIASEVARQVAAIETPKGEPGEPGRSVELADVAPLIADEVARQMAALPPAEAGKSVTVDDVRPLLEEMVAALEVPKGEPGEPGKSVELADVAPLIADEVTRQMAALPPAEPGKSVTVEDLRPMLQGMVDAIEVPPGEPGKSLELGDVAPLIAEEVAHQVAAIPAAEPGKSVTVEDVRPMLQGMVDAIEVPRGEPGEPGKSVEIADVAPLIADEVARQVAAIPPAEPGKSVTVEDVRPLLEGLVAAIDVPKGAPGPRGDRGPEGRLGVAKAWSDEVHYEGTVVTHRGATWQALRDTGREPEPGEDWICLAAAGQRGTDARSPRVRDTFDPMAQDYRELDIVALNGGAFIARRDNPGPCPGDGWKLIAMQGKTGKPGERGAQGPRGPAGPGVVALEVTDQGLLTLANGDASKVELDLYPLLAKLQG